MADAKSQKNAATDAAKANSGLLGRAARAIAGRSRQIDDAVDAALSDGPTDAERKAMHDRQHTDSNNND